MSKALIRAAVVASASLLAGACSGGSVFGPETTDPGTNPGGTPPQPDIRLGSFTGSTFNPGVIGVAPAGALTAGSSTTLTVSLVDVRNNNAPVTGAGAVTFSSQCLSQGDSTLSENPADIDTGTATVNYTYSGASCGSNTDLVTASVVASTGQVVASATLTVTPSPATAVEFVSANPVRIALQGSGQATTSQVVFVVTNAAGGAVEGQTVNFALDTTVGGITLTPASASAVTGANGRASITVQAGTVPTSVTVTASLVDNPATPANEALVQPAKSSSLVISTGRPDQDSFSLSVGCFNIEGGDFDGETTNINIFASDRFNNPVTPDTTISFRAEGGTIEPNCFTDAKGSCTVDFTSSRPRLPDHRATIVAYAVGEESFNDVNGNGRRDTGEAFTDLGDAFVNADESFTDLNGNMLFDDGEETFTAGDTLIDFNGNGGPPDPPNGLFTGPLCNAQCDTATSLYVRQSTVIIMSGSTADIDFNPASGVILSPGNPAAVVVSVGDLAGQPMPGGTTISASVTGGAGSISGQNEFRQVCTTFNGPIPYTFVLQPPSATTDVSGELVIAVTTPRGVVTQASLPVTFTTSPPPPPPPPAPIGSIRFVSATPTSIGIQGTGLGETSNVLFQVLTETGGPVADQPVDFSLTTTVGGITLQPTTRQTDSQGFVRTIVRSGTVHTSVRVIARTVDAANANKVTTAQSDSLVITTGFADQDSFSLSMDCFNLEALNIDGVTASVNVRAADRFNNPVAEGTAVAFTTEGGSIAGDCNTVGKTGACSVTWTSQNPRPANGRATILATALGEESFTDVDGDFIHQAGEQSGADDLGEAFRDDNENGVHDAGEPFLDFGSPGGGPPNQLLDGPSGNFTGVLCETGCDQAKNLHVRDSVVVVMSGSNPIIDTSNATLDISCPSCTSYNNRTFTIPNDALAVMEFVVRDVNDQPMPRGTTINVESTGDAGGFVGTTEYLVPCTTDDSAGGNTYLFAFDAAEVMGVESGVIELKVTVPSGLKTVFPFSVVTTP